jgi:hypothetical protein
MGQLNIKDEELIERLRRLAERRQTTMTDALRGLVQEAEERDAEAREAERQRRMAAMDAIVARSAPLFDPDWDGSHDFLYGDDGLPA